MSVIMPTIDGYVVRNTSGDILLETNNIAEAQAMIVGTNNILQYIFKEIEPDATIHWGVSFSQ